MQLHDALLCLWRVYKALICAWLEHRCQRVLLERRDALQVAFVPVAVGAERGQFFVRSEGSERRRVVQLQRVFLASVIAAALALVVVLAQQSLSLSLLETFLRLCFISASTTRWVYAANDSPRYGQS